MLAGTAPRTVCAYTATLPTAPVAQPIATCAVAYFLPPLSGAAFPFMCGNARERVSSKVGK
jgi:hypothetical protein